MGKRTVKRTAAPLLLLPLGEGGREADGWGSGVEVGASRRTGLAAADAGWRTTLTLWLLRAALRVAQGRRLRRRALKPSPSRRGKAERGKSRRTVPSPPAGRGGWTPHRRLRP